MFNTKVMAVIIGMLVVGAAAGFMFLGDSDEGAGETPSFFSKLNPARLFGGGDPNEVVESPLGTNPGAVSGLSEGYLNPDYGFSFRHPAGITVTAFGEEAGDVILAQKAGSREGFQVFISEYDEPGPVTPERIKKDVPDMVVDQPAQVLIGEGKTIQALIFLSQHESLGRTREVWFVQGGSLYQITAYADQDNFLGPVLETLRFQ